MVVVLHGGRRVLAVGPDLSDDAGDHLFGVGVAERARCLATGGAGGGHAVLLLLLLLLHGLLLLLVGQLLCSLLLGLRLRLGHSSLLLMHTGPYPDVGDLLLCNGAWVDVVVGSIVEGETVLAVVDAHVHTDVHGQARVPGAVHHGVAAHHGHLVQAGGREHGEAGVVTGIQAGDGTGGKASLLLEALVLVARLCGCLEVVVDICAGGTSHGRSRTGLPLQRGRLGGRGHLAKVEELIGVDALIRMLVEGGHGHGRLDCGSHVGC